MSDLSKMVDERVYGLLKSPEFTHIYKHLVVKSKDSVLVRLKYKLQDELNDMATEGVHTEYMDNHHSSTSASVDSDTVLELTETYKKDLEDLDTLYDQILSK